MNPLPHTIALTGASRSSASRLTGCFEETKRNFPSSRNRTATEGGPKPALLLLAAATMLAPLLWMAPATDAQVYHQTNLVSDLPGMAAHTDPHLVNPWGIATTATSAFWVSDNHTGLATVYDSNGAPQSLVVTVPAAAGGDSTGSPTGIVFNGTTDFEISPGVPARFIFATEDGTISAWASGSSAVIKVNNSGANAIYKGLAIGNNIPGHGAVVVAGNFLYAANFHGNSIDVFDASFAPATLPGNFTDPDLPAGYAPFNIQNIGGTLYVTYALQDANGEDDVPGPGHGYIDKFDTNGNLIGRFASGDTLDSLNSPWGMALAPDSFGEFAGALLVGNFGDGRINAFNPDTGEFLGQLMEGSGPSSMPITIEGLWGLRFGNGGNGGDTDTLYFTAGIPGPGGNIEDHGLFGSIDVIPAERQLVNISTRALVGTGDNVAIAGFILRADPGPLATSKRVLIRGIGPSLMVNGMPVAGRLMDPVLELYNRNGQLIATNDDWQDTQRTEIEATGLAPTDDNESAILAMLQTGSEEYTAVLHGKNGGTGIGLVEVYDLERNTPSHLTNISGRAFVSTGDDVLIAGIIVSGEMEERVLFRAIGPSLTEHGVNDALEDPVLDLYDGEGNVLAHNDNWKDTQQAEIMETGAAPTDDKESAIIFSPAPGNYTVIVRGKDETTGVALAEAYRLVPPPTDQ